MCAGRPTSAMPKPRFLCAPAFSCSGFDVMRLVAGWWSNVVGCEVTWGNVVSCEMSYDVKIDMGVAGCVSVVRWMWWCKKSCVMWCGTQTCDVETTGELSCCDKTQMFGWCLPRSRLPFKLTISFTWLYYYWPLLLPEDSYFLTQLLLGRFLLLDPTTTSKLGFLLLVDSYYMAVPFTWLYYYLTIPITWLLLLLDDSYYSALLSFI